MPSSLKVPLSIFLAALALRALLFGGILARRGTDGFFQPDSGGYWTLGANLAAGHGFSQRPSPPFAPDAARTPLYPVFLAGLMRLGAGPAATILVQILLSVLTCLAVMAWTHRLTSCARAACLAGLVMALDVPSILSANLVMTETLFTLLLALAAMTASSGRAAPAGLVAGLCTLCRPIAILLPVLWIPLFRRNLPKMVLFLAAALAVTAPWLLRNRDVFGSPFLSTDGSRNLLLAKAGGVLAAEEGIPLSAAGERLERQAQEGFGKDPAADPAGYGRAQAALAWRVLSEHPWTYVGNHILSVPNLLLRPERSALDLALGLASGPTTLSGWEGERDPLGALRRKTSRLTLTLVVLQMSMTAAIWPAFAYGLGALWRCRAFAAVWLLLSGIAYFCVFSGGPEAYARFRVPLMPFLAVGAGIGGAAMLRRAGTKNLRGLSGTDGPGLDPV